MANGQAPIPDWQRFLGDLLEPSRAEQRFYTFDELLPIVRETVRLLHFSLTSAELFELTNHVLSAMNRR